MAMVILPKRPKIEVTEMRIIPVTITGKTNNIGTHGFLGFAYMEALTERCPCCHQLKRAVHTTKESLTVCHSALLLEKYLSDLS